MTLIFTLPAATIYDNQKRVMSHKHTPTSREGLKQLKLLIPRLKELGVKKVICSDLDEQTGNFLARKLGVPLDTWTSLRRFNWGKLHGTDICNAAKVYESIQEPTVPVKGGDSKLSFEKRMSHSRERLAQVKEPALVIVGQQELGALLKTSSSSVERCRIYEADLGQ